MSKIHDEIMATIHEAAMKGMELLEQLELEEEQNKERRMEAERQKANSEMATLIKGMNDAFHKEGFTAEQSFELTKMLLSREVQ